MRAEVGEVPCTWRVTPVDPDCASAFAICELLKVWRTTVPVSTLPEAQAAFRMSPDTTVTLTAAQLQKNGNLQSASVVQKVGRTFTSVQHLVSGASFQVGGHSVSAQVRGTEF